MSLRMNIYEKFNDIKNASKAGKLTFFIGAGVSRLSNYPGWKDLINIFAERLGLELKGENEDYSSSEYLSIPQKYYYSIKRDDKKYYELIDSCLAVERKSNEVHDMILALKPKNIITTNFDELIEQAVSKHGLFYNVISSDESLKVGETDRLILKIHGDLKSRNIVLKEEDYLNYSEKFKLIENAVKYIFSTNTVVFIGYGVDDYNIKLILNWVRSIQGDNFKNPYFIYLEDSMLNELDIVYYESIGLDIIDINYITDNKLEWMERYKFILEKIVNNNLSCEIDDLEYLYNLFLPLNELNSLRIKDIRQKLKGDYSITEDGKIFEYDKSKKYIEKFNEKYKFYEEENNIDSDYSKYNLIKNVLEKANICGYSNSILYKFNYKSNIIGCIDFSSMIEFIDKDYEDDYENYKKAYYMFKLGNFEYAYKMYTSLAQGFFEKKNYLYYYLTQINRYMLFRIIKSFNQRIDYPFLTGFYGEKIVVDNGSSLIIENINIEEIFNSLPLSFRDEYSSFKNLYSTSELYENLYSINQYSKKIRKNITKNTIEFGSTNLSKLIGIINSELEFVYSNCLIIDEYEEYINAIKEALETYLLLYAKKYNNYINTGNINDFNSGNKIELDEKDFICMIKFFKKDELVMLFNEHKITNLKFNNFNKCLEVIESIFNSYRLLIVENKNNNSYLINKFKILINNIIKVTQYIAFNKEEYKYMVKEIFDINNSIVNIGDKIMFLDKQQTYNKNISGKTSEILDKVLVDYWEYNIKYIKENNKQPNLYSINGLGYNDIVRYIIADNNDYKSIKLGEVIEEVISNEICVNIKELIEVAPILPNNIYIRVKERLEKKLRNKFDWSIFFEGLKSRIVNVADYEKDIINYSYEVLEEINSKNNLAWQEIKRGSNYEEQIFLNIGFWCLLGELNKELFLHCRGYNNLFDFLIDVDNYDYKKFKLEWLFTLSFNIHKKLSEYDGAKNNIKKLIEDNLSDFKLDSRQKEVLLNIYLKYYNLY